MFRVLHIMAGADAGGISSVVLNYYSFMDRQRFHFDIAVTTDMVGKNGALLQELGANIHRLPLKSNGVKAFESALKKLLQEHKYDAIHVHENETSYVALRVAKKCGIKRRIAHSHTTSLTSSLRGELRRLSGCVLNYHYATNVVGCGQLAGERVFGKRNMRRKKACVLPNAIDTERFGFDPEQRDALRRELALDGKFVIGMVGRLAPEKNHSFALECMGELVKEMPNVCFLIAGVGDEEAKIRSQIQELGLEANVIMLGRVDAIHALYQTFDVLVLPSHHEGFPVAAVEAMATGLPVLLSDTITRELSFGTAVQYLPLQKETWVTALRNVKSFEDRALRLNEVKANGLELRDTARMLERLYETGDIHDSVG